ATSLVFYPLSLHDALPILRPASSPLDHDAENSRCRSAPRLQLDAGDFWLPRTLDPPELTYGYQSRYPEMEPDFLEVPTCPLFIRSEEHTSELQSRENLVCR